eukprot:IDg16113t1
MFRQWYIKCKSLSIEEVFAMAPDDAQGASKTRYWETVLGALPMSTASEALSNMSSFSTPRNGCLIPSTSLLPKPPVLISPRSQNDAIRSSNIHKMRLSRRQFGCSQCHASFERRGHLRSHIDTVHERKRPFSCPRLCGKVFGHRSSLSRHIRGTHGRDMSTVLCSRKCIGAISKKYRR